MRGIRTGAALLCLALAGCAGSPPIPRASLAGWHCVRHPSFRLVGDAPPAELERLAEELAVFDRVFARLARMPVEPLEPVSIYAIADRDLAHRFGLAGSVAGWMVATLEGCLATIEAGRTHVEMRATLLHEFTHVLLRRNRRGPLAPWYDEGLSSYFSTFGVRDGGAVIGAVPTGELAWLSERGPLPLVRLFDASSSAGGGVPVHDFYATAWALSHLLLATPRGRQELSAFAARLERGEPWRAAQAAAFGRPVERLEAELAAHVRLLSRGVAAEAVIDPGELGPRAPGAVAPVAAADIAYELGFLALEADVLRTNGSRSLLARSLFEIALDLDPSAARAEAGLAEALARGGDASLALTHGERAVARAPDDVRVRNQAGRVALARADSDGAGAASALRTAEDHYRRALALDPASAAAWEGLAQTDRRLGRDAESIEAFERARRLAWSPQIDLALGSLYLARGRSDEALALLSPLAGDPHGGRTSEEARSKLEDAGLLPREGAPSR